MSDSAKFIVGAVALFVLVLIANAVKRDPIEAELRAKAEYVLAEAGVEWATVNVSGRNAVIGGIAPSQDAGTAAVDLISGVFGIHSADGDFQVVEVVSPFLWSATRTLKTLSLAGVVPSQDVRDTILERVSELFSGLEVANEMRIAGGFPQGDWTRSALKGLDQLAVLQTGKSRLLDTGLTITGQTDSAATVAAIKENLAQMPPGFTSETDIVVVVPDVSPEPPAPVEEIVEKDAPVIVPAEAQKEIDRCQSAIDEIMTGQTINFRTSSAEVIPQPNPLIMQLARVANECPSTRIVISGHTDSVGDPEANQILSKARAQAVVNLLVDQKVTAERLTAQGFGASQPIEANTTPEGRSANRRIEFRVLYAGNP